MTGKGHLQVVHTPFYLCEEIVQALSQYTIIKNKNILVLFNFEFVEVLHKLFRIPLKYITFAADSEEKSVAAQSYGVHVCRVLYSKEEGATIMPAVKKQFDVVIANPPYQAGNGNKGKGHILWDKFVELSIQTIKDDGHMAMIHPSLWRKPDNDLRKKILKNHVLYLEMHDEKDGLETFGAETRYDWYIVKKSAPNQTKVRSQDGKVAMIDLAHLPFIPNDSFGLVANLLAKEGEEKVSIINDRSAYGADKQWVSDTQHGQFQHPCVYMVHKDNSLSLKWSRKTSNGHFGVPKVIYSSGRPVSVGFYIDTNGEYGLTQWASGIIDDPKVLPEIAAALNTKKFREFCSSISMSKLEVNTSVLRYFRKDFWKEFV